MRRVTPPLLLAVLAILAVPAHAQLVISEDWSSTTGILGNRWGAAPFIMGLDAGLETTRAIDVTNKTLDLDLRVQTVGASSSASLNMLRLLRGDRPYTDPASLRTVDVEFTIVSDKLGPAGCPIPGPMSEVGALIFLKLFNDGSSTGVDDQTGDYLATVGWTHDTEHTVPHVSSTLLRCANAACSDSTNAATNYPVGKSQFVLGSSTKGTLVRLRLAFDPAAHHVLARVGATGADTEMLYAGADDSLPAVKPFAMLGAHADTGSCTTALRSAKISATVGKVRVNPLPPA